MEALTIKVYSVLMEQASDINYLFREIQFKIGNTWW